LEAELAGVLVLLRLVPQAVVLVMVSALVV
jgi:hypothetical protein